MKPLLALGLLFLSLVSCAATAEEASSSSPSLLTAEAKKARDLVRDLADPRFRVRDAAAKELMKIGRLAKPALIEGMKSADPEVWNRCSQLLPEVLAADLKARVDAFLADAQGKQKHDLPMMERYQKIVGKAAPARKLFAEMIKTNASLLEACELNPKLAGEKYALRAQELQQQIFGPRLVARSPNPKINTPDLAALFLIGADTEMSKGIADNQFNPVSNFLWQQDFQQTIRTGELSPPFRKLFFAWAENRTDLNSISQSLQVIQNLAMNTNSKDDAEFKKDGLEYAVKVMKMKNLQVWTRAQALTCVGRLGNKDHLPAFEALFDDKTQITNIQFNNVNISTQINDIALAMAVHLSGQSHKEYGFDALQAQANLLWTYHYLGFSSDQKRTVAFKKYADWNAAQKQKK